MLTSYDNEGPAVQDRQRTGAPKSHAGIYDM